MNIYNHFIIFIKQRVIVQCQGQNYTLSKRVNGTGGGGGVEHDSILTNSYDAAKMNQVTTIIQDIKSSWNSGMVADSQRPYW